MKKFVIFAVAVLVASCVLAQRPIEPGAPRLSKVVQDIQSGADNQNQIQKLQVAGNAIIEGSVSIAGGLTQSTVRATGNASIGGNLTVTSNLTASGSAITMTNATTNATLTVDLATVKRTATVGGKYVVASGTATGILLNFGSAATNNQAITFNTAFSAAPVVVLVPTMVHTNVTTPYAGAITTTGFVVSNLVETGVSMDWYAVGLK